MVLQFFPNHISKFLFHNIAILYLTVTHTPCMVAMVAPYNEAIVQQVMMIAKKIDMLYLIMLVTSINENNGRTYEKFAQI